MCNKTTKMLLGLCLSGLLAVFFSNQSYAADWGTIKSKAALEGVYQCLNNNAFAAEWEASKGYNGFLYDEVSDTIVKLPYGKTDARDNNTNCKQIMKGFGTDISGDNLRNGMIGANYFVDHDVSSVKDFFNELGYGSVGTGSSTDGEKMNLIKYEVQHDGVVSGATLQMATGYTWDGVLHDGTDWSDFFAERWNKTNVNNGRLQIEWKPVVDGLLVFPKSGSVDGTYKFLDANVEGMNVPLPSDANKTYLYVFMDDNNTIHDHFTVEYSGGQYNINDAMTVHPDDDKNSSGEIPGFKLEKKKTESAGSSETSFTDYKLTWNKDKDNFIKGLNERNNVNYKVEGLTKYEDLALNDQEIFDLYSYYINDVYEADVICDDDSAFDQYKSLPPINWRSGSKCKIDVSNAKKNVKNVYGVDGDNHFTAEVDLDGIIERLKTIDLSTIDASGASTVTDEASDEEEGVCYANSGALGWIICPIIEGISRVGTAMWEFVESNFLQIRAGDLFQSGGGVEEVWQRFRDIANVIFIILFLFVIFSQLTGVGIDNYGIKKILPRLIVVAILVNLSFLICALAVDISNILGSGLNALFTSLAGEMPKSITSLASTDASGGSILATVGIGLGGTVLFGILNPVGALTLGGAVLGVGLAVLGIVISIVFAILFMFIILIIRNAGVVILIAVSPIAIVCYMLPNTEKFYKKWFELLKALLMVYPICGAMIGAGRLAGNLLASVPNSPGMAVAGMVVSVLPFFLVPMLLKQSLRLMGNIGARLSSVGKGVGQRTGAFARNKITGSEGVKDWSQAQKTQASVRRAQRIQNRLEDRIANGATLSRRQRSKLRNAQDVMLAQRKIEQENEVRTHAGYAEAMRYKQDRSVDAETRAIERLNDPTTRAAEAQSVANEERQQRSKARTALMMNNTRAEGLDQLMMRWNAAFDSGNSDDLDAVTNVINQRYGASGAGRVGSALSGKHDIANNQNYQASMRTLQQTMSDNSSFAGNMKTKSPDAFQMIGDAGMRYDSGTGGMVQEDMSYFTNHNETATKASDWAVASGAALQRGLNAVDEQGHYRMSNEMINTLLTSQDPAIMSGIQSEDGKREMLEAALYNRQHNPSGVGPNLDNRTASQNYRQEEADRQSFEELTISHEQDAERRGKVSINIPGSIVGNTAPTTIQGYAVPGNPTNGSWSQVGGDHVYTFRDGDGRERQWNANTGRYIRPQPPNNP